MRPACRHILADEVLQRVLLLVYLNLVVVKVSQHVNHAVVELVLLDFEATLVHFGLAELGKLDLRRSPVCEQVVCLVEQIIDAVEVPLDRDFHLIALNDLLPCAVQLFVGFVEQNAMVLHELSLLLNRARFLRTVNLTRLLNHRLRSIVPNVRGCLMLARV